MLHFNQRNWFKMSPDNTVPVPSTAKEYYLAKMVGHAPTEEGELFNGYGTYKERQPIDGASMMDMSKNTVKVSMPTSSINENTVVMLGDQKCEPALNWDDYAMQNYVFEAYNDSELWISVQSQSDANKKVVITGEVPSNPPAPKTATEFYLAKVAGLYDGELPEPKTKTEFYLAVQAGWCPDGSSQPRDTPK